MRENGSSMTVRATRIGLWLVAIAVIALVAVWMLLPVFVSSEFVRTALERELADITGQKIRVEGRVDVDLFPAPVARLYDVHVPSEPAEGADAPSDFLIVDSVEVSVPVSGLMARDLEFSQFRLVRPTMRVRVDEQGRVDFAAIGGRLGREIERVRQETEAAQDTENDAEVPARTSPYARFGTVSVDNGIVEFIGPDSENPERITAVNGIVSWPRLDERLTASLDGIWRGTAFTLRTEVDNAVRFFARQIVGVRQSFTSEMMTYAFDGKLGVGTAPFAEGKLTMAMPSPRQALNWLGVDIRTGNAVGSIDLSGTLRGDAKKIRFEDLNVKLQGNTGTGVLELAFKDESRPSVTATLDFSEIDIIGYLAALTGLPRTRDALSDPISKDVLGQLDVDLRLSAGNATAAGLRLTNVATVTQIRKGGANFELPDATAYGGRVQAHFKLMPDGGTLKGTLGVSLSDVDGAAAADALELTGLFPRGVTTGRLDINAPMEQWSDLFKRANGSLALHVDSGKLDGVSYRTFGDSAESRTFFRLKDSAQSGEAFNSLDIKSLVQDGVIIIEEGTIGYSGGTVQLNGVIPYGTASIALTTIAEQSGEAENRKPAIQHFIGGSWDNPYATPVLLPPDQP